MLKIEEIVYRAPNHFDIHDVLNAAFQKSLELGIEVSVIHDGKLYGVNGPAVVQAAAREGIKNDVYGEGTELKQGKLFSVSPLRKGKERSEEDEEFEQGMRAGLGLPDPQFDEEESQTKYAVAPQELEDETYVQRGERPVLTPEEKRERRYGKVKKENQTGEEGKEES